MFVRVLVTTGSTIRSCVIMYKAVAQSVLLYASESWVVTGAMLKVLKVYHHCVARHIMGMKATPGAGGGGNILLWWRHCKTRDYIP